MKNNILQNLNNYITAKEAQGGVVSAEIKNLVKFGKLYSEEDCDEHAQSSYETMFFDSELAVSRSVSSTLRAQQDY